MPTQSEMTIPDATSATKAFHARRFLRGVFVFAAILVAGVWFVNAQLEHARAPTRNLWSQIKVGDTEADVRQLLGEPRYEYEASSAPADYYVEGWGRKERPITGKVLVYFGKIDLILMSISIRTGTWKKLSPRRVKRVQPCRSP